MKQLFASGAVAPAGSGTNDTPAFSGPRQTSALIAFTPGTSDDERATVLTLTAYSAPAARPPESDVPLPVRLALIATPNAGRVLTHVTPVSESRYFAHALLNVPPSSDAQLAIQTWGSPHWQREEPEGSSDLPALPYLPVADVLDDDSLKTWLSTPGHRDLLEFVLAALLATPSHSRIFVAAKSDDMAKVIYAATRAFPPGMLDDLTFSTYVSDPLIWNARIIGYDSGSADWDLPGSCYTDAGVAINLATGKRSTLPSDVPFAAFAAGALASGDHGPLDDFKNTWQRLGLKTARQFDLVFRLARGTGVLTKEETAEALQYPPLTSWVAARADALNQFLEWSLEDREFATSSFSRVVQALRQKPDLLGKLAQTVREQGIKALRDGDKNRTANALEITFPMVAPSKANAIWGDLITQLSDPGSVTWPMRWYLLPKFVRFRQQQGQAGVDPALAKWVDVPTEMLGELLALELPRPYHLAAARSSLNRITEPTPELTRTLAANPSLTLTLLQAEKAGANTEKQVKLFELLLTEAPAYPWFEELLTRPSDYPAALLNKFFEATLTAGKVDADRVIRTQGPRLLELFAGQSGLDRVGKLFLASPPPDLLHQSSLLEFLGKLKDESQVSDEVKARVSAVQGVRAYLDNPGFDADVMKPAADGLTVSPPVVPLTATGEVFTAVANGLLKRASSPDLQTDLESALTHFGGVLANDSTDLYENLLRDLRGRTDLAKNANLVTTFLAVSLGATKTPELSGKLDGLDGHAFAVASDAAKRGGNRMLDEIDRRSADWPKAAKVQWGFLHAAVRPPSIPRGVRDALMFVAGVLVTSGVWFAVLKLLK